MSKRVFIIVLDSLGVGEAPDAASYGDSGSNTLRALCSSPKLYTPNLTRLGLYNIDQVGCGAPSENPAAAFARMAEASKGKDTTTGHWELAGIISQRAMPTYPDGFPKEVIRQLTEETGRGILCNKPYSGTAVIADYGQRHLQTGSLIVYTSADSVLQIAAHEQVVPVDELYRCCEIARKIMTGQHSVGRIIARPFEGEHPHFVRTANRHDYSLAPPGKTMLDYLHESYFDTIGVGKIYDIFAGQGLSESYRTVSNNDGMNRAMELLEAEFEGICFINLVDFDMHYGHRNDVDGYAQALTDFDAQLGDFLERMEEEDLLIITADHGCDPSTPSTDHSREYVPMLLYGKTIKSGVNLGARATFADVAATVLEYLGVKGDIAGVSFLKEAKI